MDAFQLGGRGFDFLWQQLLKTLISELGIFLNISYQYLSNADGKHRDMNRMSKKVDHEM